MKKYSSICLLLCITLSMSVIVRANETDPEAYEYAALDEALGGYSYDYQNYNYNEAIPEAMPYEYDAPSLASPSPDIFYNHADFDHFATATIDELHASSYYGYSLNFPEEEIPCFDPPTPPPIITPPRYTSAAVVVMDADTGLVLYGNQHHTQLYPASITKIMTALLVLEHVHDLTQRIEFSHNAVFSIPRNSSHIAMDVGETLTVYQALYGLMLSSANEVSIALAEHVSGTVEAFADKMNARAKELGTINTHFVNPSGLPDEGHVTTAYDMALIMREAINHQIFVDIIKTRRFDIPPTERQNYTRELLNTNRLIHPGSYFNEWVIGSKTGWTSAAQHTLVTYAEHEGRRLIISTLQASSGGNFRDTLALMSFGFSMPFDQRLVFEAAAYIRMVPVYQNINDRPLHIGYVTLQADNNLYFMLPQDFDIRDLRYDLNIPANVAPPIAPGDILGRVAVYVQDIKAGEVELIAQNLVMGLPVSEYHQETEGAGGGERHGILVQAGYSPGGYSGGYYPGLTVYPTSIWANEYFQELALPLAIIILAIIISLFFVATSRRRRMKKVLSKRHVRHVKSYRYRQ